MASAVSAALALTLMIGATSVTIAGAARPEKSYTAVPIGTDVKIDCRSKDKPGICDFVCVCVRACVCVCEFIYSNNNNNNSDNNNNNNKMIMTQY